MLGKKRNSSVFLKAKEQQNVSSTDENAASGNTSEGKSISSVSNRAIEMLEIKEIEGKIEEIQVSQEVQETQRELGSENRTHSLFFTPETEGKDFSTVLKDVQEYISSNYSVLITDGTMKDSKEQMKRYISKYVQDSRISVKGMSGNELIDALYTEMAEYGFLTKYIYGEGIEEIDSATRS